jgi:hypothetical protein
MKRDQRTLGPVKQAGGKASVSRQKEPLVGLFNIRYNVMISGSTCSEHLKQRVLVSSEASAI